VNALPERYRDLPRFAFGDGPALADELAALVVAGRKTATCMSPDDPNRPQVGERWIVLDGRAEPVCVIETAELTECRFDEVEERFAFDEGEGDRTLETWRRNHRIYFGRLGTFAEDMRLVCERFRVVEVLGGPGASP
jgi:uncharacterized protein YhfF